MDERRGRRLHVRCAFARSTRATGLLREDTLADGTGGQVELDSAQEGLLLLDLLRNEKPVFYDATDDLIMTGMEPVGEGEEGAAA